MSYAIYKLTYSEGQAYRYHISDEAGRLCYVAEPTGMSLPSPTRRIEFFDLDRNLACRLQPLDVPLWHLEKSYEVFVGGETERPYAVIAERWRWVDVLLLRLPHYEVQLGERRYVAWGSRYGERFYEILRPCEEGEADEEQTREGLGETQPGDEGTKVGQIRRPTAGPSYVVEADVSPLRQAPLVLAALVILIDMQLYV